MTGTITVYGQTLEPIMQ